METTHLSVFQQTIKKQEEWFFVKPLCDFFQIDYENQVDKIRNDSILASQSVKKPNEMLFGENRPRVCLSKKGFIRWIQLINSNTLPEELREKFQQYQADVFDFFYGTAEEQEKIARLNLRLQTLKSQRGEIGNEIKKDQAELTETLNQRYQYRIEF